MSVSEADASSHSLTGLHLCTHDACRAQLLGYADETLQVAAGVAVGRPGVHVPTGFPAAADAALTQDASALILSLAEQHQVRASFDFDAGGCQRSRIQAVYQSSVHVLCTKDRVQCQSRRLC